MDGSFQVIVVDTRTPEEVGLGRCFPRLSSLPELTPQALCCCLGQGAFVAVMRQPTAA